MNEKNNTDPDLDKLLLRAFKEDLPPDTEARMRRQFLRFRHTLEGVESRPEWDKWCWVRGRLGKEILAVASAVMLILGCTLQLDGSQNVLAHSIEQLKVLATITGSLNRASSLDCKVTTSGGEGEKTSYRVRWHAAGDVRVDMDAANGSRSLRISNETVSMGRSQNDDVNSISTDTIIPGPVWQPVLEFISPKVLAEHINNQYGLMQSGGRTGTGSNEFKTEGMQERQKVEITVDAKTYLPKTLRKYSLDSKSGNEARNCIMEARFIWNRPVAAEIFNPQFPTGER